VRVLVLTAPLLIVAACGSSSSPVKPSGGDAATDQGGVVEAGAEAAAGPKIEHLVVIVQENHTFDSYFGQWCTAPAGSAPTCTEGPSCCEAGPSLDPGSQKPFSVLNDAFNAARDPDHTQACELTEIDGGKMDGFVTSSVCGSVDNFAYADSTVQAYWTLAAESALADRYFQPVVGQSSSNDMYLARAQFVFLDNEYEPEAIGASCSLVGTTNQYTDPTIADLLNQAGVSWAWYSEGYTVMAQAVATGTCPTTGPSDCAFGGGTFDCGYDPGDDPFAYYKDLVDNPEWFKDYSAFATDVASGNLPSVSYIKALEYKTEHPGYGNTLTAGITFVSAALETIAGSPYAASTLVLLTWDEGGGLFDHVSPPPDSAVDHQPYGTRIPLIAVGPFARAGTVSHVVMEHSSIVKFIEQNWLGATGQLKGRDAVVANIGSLLDPSLGVPEN
jgi:phospholipase C